MVAATPLFLWGLLAAAIPIILYLLFRRRRRDVSWGAIYILRQVMEAKNRQMAWLQYLIVALRTVALIALALVLAGLFRSPRAPAAGILPAAPRSTYRLILLDTSASMQARFENGCALDAALSLSRQLVQGGRTPGTVDILSLHGEDSVPCRFDAFPVEDSVLEEKLVQMASTSKPVNLENTLKHAVTLFRESPWTRRELYILSDFNQRDFSGSVADTLDTLRKMNVTVYPVSFHRPDAWNFAILDLTPGSDLLLANQPALFRVTIGCYGRSGTAETLLTISTAAGEPLFEQALTMAPGEKQLTIPLKLPAGQQTVVARLRDDDMAWDNAAKRTFVVRPELTVMVIQDIDTRTGFENPRTWLARALADVERREAAIQDHSKGEVAAINDPSRPFRVNVSAKIPEQISQVESLLPAASGSREVSRVVDPRFADRRLAQDPDTDMAVVLASAKMPASTVETLRRYALQGGTVLLAPGPEDVPAVFNKVFGPLAPAALGPPRRAAINPEEYEQGIAEAGDSLLRELESTENGNLGSPRFYNSFAVDGSTLAEDSRILLGLSDGAPLLLERRLGRGRCLLWTAGLSGAWHSMVVHPAYPVFLIRFIQQAAADRAFPRNLSAGMPILTDTMFDRVMVRRPDGKEDLIETLALGKRRFVRYSHTDLPGSYEVRPQNDPTVPPVVFHVAQDCRESDIRPLTSATRESLERSFGSALIEQEPALGSALAATYPGRPLAGWCLAILVLCLVLEAGLSRRFFV